MKATTHHSLLIIMMLSLTIPLFGEGSKDMIANKGYRLFFNTQQKQQLKVYAAEGEFIHVGSSHVGVSGGYIRVIRPNGTVAMVYNNTGNTAGQAIIHNKTQELFGPTGGGNTNGPGYIPGVIAVQAGEAGIWTVTLEYPTYTSTAFNNLLATDDWNRIDHQPTNQRVVLAWDITVSKNKPINEEGIPLTGRVFTQEYGSLVNDNGPLVDLQLYVMSDEGIIYRLQMEDMDPWGWFVYSNNRGVVDFQNNPIHRSVDNTEIIRSWQPDNWQPGQLYLYEPQTRDATNIKNNKLFFNMPDPDMPEFAGTWDVHRQIGHQSWLKPQIPDYSNPLKDVDFSALQGGDSIYSICGKYTMGEGIGGYITFSTVGRGNVTVKLDINLNGQFNDPIDRNITKIVLGGKDSLYWDGRDGLGNIVGAQKNFPLTLNFSGTIYSGEMHFMFFDVENMAGGIEVHRLNGVNPGMVPYYYDHSTIGGAVSGGGTPGNALPTTSKYAYSSDMGDEKLMDFWSYIVVSDLAENITIYIDIVDSCIDPDLDSDGDGIIDIFDLDDDNDGIPDYMEYCNGTGFDCMPGGFDPSGDNDKDKIPNYRDANDPTFINPCIDADGDGICDAIASIYDHDGDGVPDHLDLDSDNDGISDISEASHGVVSFIGNGRINAPNVEFGDNGFYNDLSNKPNGLDAIAIYKLPDGDNDGVPDNDDLDSDNDGIHDVAENGNQQWDSNNDGMLDNGLGNPSVDKDGVPVQISYHLTGNPLPQKNDFDGDGVYNQNDLDSDNDGIHDVTETPNPDGDGDGIIGFGKPTVDKYGRPLVDFPGNTLNPTSNPANTDGTDGADFIDLDSDGDGIWDTYEAGVTDPDMDGTAGVGKPTVDVNGVPILDENGNPIVIVTLPPDNDSDGLPDYKDTDSDNDGISDRYECFDIENGYTMLPCLDSDGDGIPDIHDLDSDNDGLADTVECPNGDTPDCPDSSSNGVDDFRDPNIFFNEDTDGDGIPNIVDLDNDNDGIPDTHEFCAQSGFACLPGSVHPDGDEDGDKIPNFMDADDSDVNNPCVDANGDGICDRVHEAYDYDGDGIANHNDLDSENDGIPDMYEAGHFAPDGDGNGMIDGPPSDFGQNGLYNAISDHPHSLNANITYTVRDADNDKVNDFRDLDSDNDGIYDVAEMGYQIYDSDDDGMIDNGQGLPDISWMGIPRVVSKTWTNLPIKKPRDSDGDNIPDYRDIDSDNDGIHDVREQGVLDTDDNAMPGVGSPVVDKMGRLQFDGNNQPIVSTGVMNDTDGDGTPDYLDYDSDGDSIPDVLEAEKNDPDMDGRPGVSPVLVNNRGALIADNQGNGISSTSMVRDLDGDGKPDFQDIDRDGDGIRDGYECVFPYACVDTDADGIPDVDDLNSDNDCELDADECPGGDPCPDATGSGIPDFRRFDCCPLFAPNLELAASEITACSGKSFSLMGSNLTPFPGSITYTWSGPGFSYTNTVNNPSPLTATFIPVLGSSGVYRLTAVSSQGCAGDTATISITVKQTPITPALQVDPQIVCNGDELILSTQQYSGPGVTYNWYFTNNNNQTLSLGSTQTPLFIIDNASNGTNGTYWVIVTVDGCDSDAANQVLVNVLPPADLNAMDDQFLLYLQDVTMEDNVLKNDSYNTGTVNVQLIEGPQFGTLLLFANGTFRYTAEPGFFGTVNFVYQICGELCDNDCDTAIVTIIVSKDQIPEDCEVYNILTPNGDGANDFLTIPCLDLYPEHELRIFNRWGDEVYYTNKYKQDWVGMWNGHPLPPGTYFYLLEVYGSNPQNIQGYITILR